MEQAFPPALLFWPPSTSECSVHWYTAMAPQWDPAKARTNLRKHGVRFADAVTALEDEKAISIRDEDEDEDRWVAIGMDSLARILVVVFTWRDEEVRMISARPATRRESRQYQERYEEGI